MGTYSITQLYNKIGDLATQKENLRQALLAKGADVSTNVLLDDYPTVINNICPHPDIRLEYMVNGPESDVSTKSVYFDTGFVPTTNTKIECKTYLHNISAENHLFGNVYNSSWSGIRCFPGYSSGQLGGRLGSKTVYCGDMNIDEIYIISVYGNNGVEMNVNGTIINNGSYSWATNDITAYIFAEHHYSIGARLCYSGTRMYYLTIWDNGTLVRNYIPVLHWYNNVYTPCFYDKVNDNYIYNLGTDTPNYKIR